MGLMQWLRKRSTPTIGDQPVDPDWANFVDAVVVDTEAVRARWHDVTTAREVAKRIHGPALGCAHINAKVCAHVPIRMFRPQTAGGKRYGKTVTDRRTLEYLHDFRRVGRKAAMMADQGDDVVEVMDNPVLDLLRRPNPYRTGTEFEVGRWMDKWLFGNDVMLTIPGGAGLVGLVTLMPQYVRVQPDNERLISGYYFGRSEQDVEYYDANSVIHQQFAPHWNNPYWGMGPLDIVFRELDLYEFSLAAEQARWQKGGYPGGVLSLKNATNQTQLDEASKSFKRQVGGASKSGNVLVTTDSTYTQLGKTNEMGYLPGMEHIERRIEQEFGIPESLRRLNDANLASGQMGPDLYLKFTIQPALAMDAEQLTERLLPYFGMEPGEAWFAYDDVSPADLEALRQDTTTHVAAGVLTCNEQRSRLGYEPIHGGDIPRVNGVPLGQVQSQPSINVPSQFSAAPATVSSANTTQDQVAASGEVAQTALNGAQVQALEGLAASVAQGQLPADAARAIAEAAFPLVSAAILDRIFGSLDSFVPDQPAVDQSQPMKAKALDDGLAADQLTDQEKERLIGGMQRAMQAWITGSLSDLRIGPDAAVNLSGRDDLLAAALEPYIRRLIEAGFTIGSREVSGLGGNPVRVSDEVAAELVRQRGSLIIEQIRGTTEDQIRSAILTGLEDQAPLNQVIDTVKADIGDGAAARAETIARTETSHAVGMGQLAAWKAAGITRKRWKLATDACEVCNALVAQSGGEVGIDEPFARAGTNLAGFTPALDIQHNPAHPNCRCITQPVL